MRIRPSEGGRERGFTLIEATVAMAILVIIMVMALTLLFSMKSFAQRQQYFTDARQNARRAVDYLAYYVRGAGDMNPVKTYNALVMWTYGAATAYQVSFDNMGSNAGDPAGVADSGTDVLSLAYATGARAVIVASPTTGIPNNGSIMLKFVDGCAPANGPYAGGTDQINLKLFEQLTGCTGTCDGTAGFAPTVPIVLTLVNNPSSGPASGQWCYYVVTSYTSSTCANASAGTVINVTTSAARNSNAIDTPSKLGAGAIAGSGAVLAGGVQYYAFRVLNSQLQQKTGVFDPTGTIYGTADNPGTAFQPLMDNVEDLQFAYIYNDGTIWNDNANNRLAAGSKYIPNQDNAPGNRDITNVVGLRVTVVARSTSPLGSYDPAALTKYPLLTAEDHVPTQPAAGNVLYRYYRYRLSSTMMLRSRMLGD